MAIVEKIKWTNQINFIAQIQYLNVMKLDPVKNNAILTPYKDISHFGYASVAQLVFFAN